MLSWRVGGVREVGFLTSSAVWQCCGTEHSARDRHVSYTTKNEGARRPLAFKVCYITLAFTINFSAALEPCEAAGQPTFCL